jgi:hypothetical protein
MMGEWVGGFVGARDFYRVKNLGFVVCPAGLLGQLAHQSHHRTDEDGIAKDVTSMFRSPHRILEY